MEIGEVLMNRIDSEISDRKDKLFPSRVKVRKQMEEETSDFHDALSELKFVDAWEHITPRNVGEERKLRSKPKCVSFAPGVKSEDGRPQKRAKKPLTYMEKKLTDEISELSKQKDWFSFSRRLNEIGFVDRDAAALKLIWLRYVIEAGYKKEIVTVLREAWEHCKPSFPTTNWWITSEPIEDFVCDKSNLSQRGR